MAAGYRRLMLWTRRMKDKNRLNIDVIAFWVLVLSFGTLLLARLFLSAELIDTTRVMKVTIALLVLAMLVAYLVHFFEMLVHAVQNRRVGWVLGMFFLNFIASFFYYISEYSARRYIHSS